MGKQQSLEATLLTGSELGFNQKRWRRALWVLLALIAIACLGVVLCSSLSIWTAGDGNKFSGRGKARNAETVESGQGQKAAVAADDGRCSKVGLSILKTGGHAVDAAVATALCLGVVNPVSSGIGGGAFMLVRSASTSEVEAIDMRETAPLAASKDMYENDIDSKTVGALSMGVPGEVAGLHEAWLKHGRLPWSTLFQPAIRLARYGFVVATYLATDIAKKEDLIMNDPGLRGVYAPNGKLLQEGDICYNVELSNSLEAIAEQGPEAFYNGTVGEKLVEDVQKAGGILTMEDLRNYRVKVRDPIVVNAMGYTIFGMPPPSSGTVGLSLILKVLESYPSSVAAEGPLGLHRMIEAVKHMLGVRMNLGDPDFVNVSSVVYDMLSPSFAQMIQQRIYDNTTFPSEYYMPRWSLLRDHGTSHFCIVDADRNAVAMTTTVNYLFGAGLLSPSTGIVLNNEMGDFSVPTEVSTDKLPPSPANFISPNKRPLSSMTPIVVLKDNQLAAVIGGSGGTNIIATVTQVFLNHFVLGMDPLEAVQSPRVYHKLIPNTVLYENWTIMDGEHIELSGGRRRFLEGRGHQLQAQESGAICQFLVQNLPKPGQWLNNGTFYGMLTAVSDPRKGGSPAAI
ncbi:glutathione hydrolase 3-like [Ipomoea triloba]|uniref:glutathione hydrolase 3-like n=1 Tax=Ipomoea triloba TaxID=35885 RepID=UPI00125D0366|nr:glutathione hydrolase 3-like [Ipomoea triloba]